MGDDRPDFGAIVTAGMGMTLADVCAQTKRILPKPTVESIYVQPQP